MTTRHNRSGLEILHQPERAEAVWWWRLRVEELPEYRERLFSAYLDFARAIAARHSWRARERGAHGDAQHWAYEGLLQAIDMFDLVRGVPFKAFARRRITGSVYDGMARLSELDAQHHQHRRVERERLSSLKSQVDADKVADPVAAIGRLASGLAIGIMLEGTRLMAADVDPDPEPNAYDGLAWRQLQRHLANQLDRLPDSEARVVRYHYRDGMSFAQIAELLGLSRGRISQLHRAALERLRKRVSREEFQ